MVYYRALDKSKFTEILKREDLPSTASFAIYLIENKSVYHEGDQRSRDCPGHGYPSYSEDFNTSKLFVTQDKNAWIEGIKKLYEGDEKRKDIMAFEIAGVATVGIQVAVTVQ